MDSGIEVPVRILFFTTQSPHTIKAEWPYYQNYDLPRLLQERGAVVTLKSWTDNDLLATLDQFDVVAFLWCNEYYKHPKAFFSFLDKLDTAMANCSDIPRIINHTELVRWNADKQYLLEMEREGFEIPKTRIVDPQQYSLLDLESLIQKFQPVGSLVLKPSMSGSSKMTWRIAETSALTAADVAYLELCRAGQLQSLLLLQEFEPDIFKGEYSFVFVDRHLTHGMLKTPREGEFRVQGEFGGSAKLVDISEVKSETLRIVKSIFEMLRRRFGRSSTGEMGYVRIDGLITDDRPFVLMEIEAIEPHLWLEMGKGRDELLSYLMASS